MLLFVLIGVGLSDAFKYIFEGQRPNHPEMLPIIPVVYQSPYLVPPRWLMLRFFSFHVDILAISSIVVCMSVVVFRSSPSSSPSSLL